LYKVRYLAGFVALYVLVGWLIVGLPRSGECTSEQRAGDPDACGISVFVRDTLLWPLRPR